MIIFTTLKQQNDFIKNIQKKARLGLIKELDGWNQAKHVKIKMMKGKRAVSGEQFSIYKGELVVRIWDKIKDREYGRKIKW